MRADDDDDADYFHPETPRRMNNAAAAGMHRTRNGRLEVDQLSRRLQPRWKMVRVDGRWYDRRALAAWLLGHPGLATVPYAPASRAGIARNQVAAITDANPYRLWPPPAA